MQSQKIATHNNDLEKLLENLDWNITEAQKKKLKEFAKAYKEGFITGNVSDNSNVIKVLFDEKIYLENTNSITPSEAKVFRSDLLSNKIVSFDKHKQKYCGKPYADKRKKSILRNAKRLSEFIEPKKDFSILDVKIKIKRNDKQIISEKEHLKLQSETQYPEMKSQQELLYLLGARAEEIFNVRLSDVSLPKGDEQFVEIRFREEFSKTEGRTLKVMGKNSLKIIKEQMARRMSEGAEPEDTFFRTGYKTFSKRLLLLGREVLGRDINAHLYRHTCATRLANTLNRQQLCYWFGWKFSSPMPDTYIRRNGIDLRDVIDSFEKTNVEELKDEVRQEINALKNGFEMMMEVIKANPNKRIKDLQFVIPK